MANNIQETKDFPYIVATSTATITSGSASSSAVDLRGTELQAIVTPAALTGTTLTLYASIDDSTYNVLTNMQGTTVSAVVAASKHILVDPTVNWRGVRWLKLISSSTEAAARSITLVSTP